MEYRLELPRHDFCLFVGFRPSQYSCLNESSWSLFRRLEPMFWAVVSPETVIAWAFRQ